MASTQTSTSLPLNSGDTSWVLISSALVFIMAPGLGFFYAGIGESKNTMSILVSVLLSFAVSMIHWALIGFSLAFSDTTDSPFLGNLDYFALLGTMTKTNPEAPTIPASLFALYQMMFAAIAPALFIGATAGRMRLIPTIIFVILWSTFVYSPCIYWVWSDCGWLHNLNVMDYAGGSVVHVTSGTTALILALMLGPRIDYDGEKEFHAHSPTYVYLGTGLLWFGWMGFNGGSSVAANSRGVNAAFTSNLAASAGGVTWMILDTIVNQKKYTAIGLCTGAIAGLAAVTPGSGFVQPGVGIIFGIISAICCFYSVKLMKKLRIDDTLDVAPVHGVGGAVGMLLTGVFAQYQVTQVDITPGVEPTAGWLDGVWVQVPVQFLAIISICAWSALWSAILVHIMNKFPFTELRCSAEAEIHGLDETEIGEADHLYHHIIPNNDVPNDGRLTAVARPDDKQALLTA
ncbi:ammonium transporter [Rhizoclosmatium globosum]|uniref:Ammonium transporter n=1 Tax=Rhizoclosmatium globosum TaxID=329046 RepID=A0A1Y2B5A3_9FUNG|nr:ammonium transporter [Rhizoclosmatium globosum]|eukprot:ORY29730.1 ammonium transporter [Rhizoclosmatium globosum]